MEKPTDERVNKEVIASWDFFTCQEVVGFFVTFLPAACVCSAAQSKHPQDICCPVILICVLAQHLLSAW